MSTPAPDTQTVGRMLTADECFQLLATDTVGHVNLSRHPLPRPMQVPYALEGRDLVLLPDLQAGLQTLLDGALVALEVGASWDQGWYVVAFGRATSHHEGTVRIRGLELTGHTMATQLLAG